MSRILFAWELGAGVGHLASFRPVAEALLGRGHSLTLAARDLTAAVQVYGDLPLQIVAAPACTRSYGGLADPPLNFAEILMRYGYLDPPQLRALLRAWSGLLDLGGTTRLVADHAPTALLAARGRAVRCLTFGNPFAVPPAVAPTPNMRDWLEVPAQRLRSSDNAVLGTINAALPGGVAPLGALHELFGHAGRLYVGVPELDPYGARASGDYLGLHTGHSGSAPANWPQGEGPRIFAYLRAEYPHIETCLQALAASGARCLVHLVGLNPAIRARHEGPAMAFSAGHVDIDAAVAGCDLVVCHSGLGTVNAALQGGKPLLLLPLQLEQFLLARKVAAWGAGLTVHAETGVPAIAAALGELLTQSVFADRARELARHWSGSAANLVARVVARIEAGAGGAA